MGAQSRLRDRVAHAVHNNGSFDTSGIDHIQREVMQMLEGSKGWEHLFSAGLFQTFQGSNNSWAQWRCPGRRWHSVKFSERIPYRRIKLAGRETQADRLCRHAERSQGTWIRHSATELSRFLRTLSRTDSTSFWGRENESTWKAKADAIAKPSPVGECSALARYNWNRMLEK